jgi:DNA (cytosine-5)-methyltransferase 1
MTGERAAKPPLRIPTMQEIRGLTPNGFKVVSTFAGGGGSSTGYRMAGFEVLFANEFVDLARETYKANASPSTVVDGRDIRTLSAEDILQATNLRPGELDVLDGSPPCSSFSTAGSREKKWGKVSAYSTGQRQRTDDLFFEFVRLVDGLRPKVFVAENVSGLVKGTAKGYFIDIIKRLKSLGYRVEAKLLDAKWLGVPQSRQRVIFVGVRDDLRLPPAFPPPLPYLYTLRETVPSVLSPVLLADDPEFRGYAIHNEWLKLRVGEHSERYFELSRLDPDRPAPTVTATNALKASAGPACPFAPRKYRMDELRIVCGFPSDFVVTGNADQQRERLGRAVPPLMMRAIAETVRDQILRRITNA